jgi:CrcB protein
VTPADWAGVAVAGAVGAPLRYLVDGWVQDAVDGPFPWGTLVVNITGSLVLGVVTGLALYHGFRGTPRLVLGSGFCGAYTTFSTATFEIVRLAEADGLAPPLRYALASLLAGTAAAAAGLAVAAI